MIWADRIRRRLVALVRKQELDRDLDDEMRQHIALEAEELARHGLSPEDALRRAHLAFGAVESHKDAVRDARGVRPLEIFAQDIRYTIRGLRAKPGFTLAVVLTLGLGIGANAAMFSVVDRLLFRTPPYLREPSATHRVYFAQLDHGQERFADAVSFARYNDVARLTHSFVRTALFASYDLAVGESADVLERPVGVVTSSFWGFFNAPPALGRYFTELEDRVPSGMPVAVVSYDFWQTQLGGRRDVLGANVRIGPLVYTIIGVSPAGFVGVWPDRPPVAFIPITSYGGTIGFSFRGKVWYNTYVSQFSSMLAQRSDDVSEKAAAADLTNALLRSYENQHGMSAGSAQKDVTRPHAVVGSVLLERGPNESSLTKVAIWVSGVALAVLLIACSNVANLLLTRAVGRRREIALRVALGVTRGRLVSQLLTETLILACLGGAAGIALAAVAGTALRNAFLPTAVETSVGRDPRTLVFALTAALAVGILAGLAPYLQARRVDLTSDLKSGTRDGMHRHSRARNGLLVVQGALSVVLLVGAGLFVRSLGNIRGVRLGYDVAPLLIVDLHMRGVPIDTAQGARLRERLLATAHAIPEAQSAARVLSIPFGEASAFPISVPGMDSAEKLPQFDLNIVSPEYFETVGTRIVRGRGFSDQDLPGTANAMVVSAAMAKILWHSGDPIGKCVKIRDVLRGAADSMPCRFVVGVAEDIKEQSFSRDAPYYYLAAAQFHPETGGLFIRVGRGEASRVAESVRRAVQAVMPGGSYVTVTPFSRVINGQTQSWKSGSIMLLAFGGLALVLATIGLFSVVSYNVAQRTQELGVRVALGATVRDLLRLVMGEAVQVGVISAAVGVAIAFAGGRWISPLLFEESPRDPAIFALVVALLLAVGLLASFVPALRASRVDPSLALRSD